MGACLCGRFALVVMLAAVSVRAQVVGAGAAAKQDAATTKFVITGMVINSVDGAPVAHCHLSPTQTVRAGTGNRQFPASTGGGFDTDGRGRFSVSVPSAGSWRLTASARGFVTQAYEEHQTFSSAIVLTADAPTIDIVFKISPEARITGVVLDEAGEPVRQAQISLQGVPPPVPGGVQPGGNVRGAAITDDRGMYELPNLSPGSYKLSVRAHPWYATAASQAASTGRVSPDPSLDFAYPPTWFPGGENPEQAETIVLHAGDTREADFHLIPMPSIHVKIVPPPRPNTGPNTPPLQTFPIIQQIGQGSGFPNMVQASVRTDAQGQIDVSGMTPGLYQIRLNGPNQDGRSALVEVTANGTRTVDMSVPSSDLARVTVRIEGLADADTGGGGQRGGAMGGIQVTLIDTDTHRGSFSSNGSGGMGGSFGGRGQQRDRDADADRVIEAPPGRYEVVLQGRPSVYPIGLTAKGAETSGRYVTVPAGESTLTVHVASGRAILTGVATLQGKPVIGAMVLLVPVTIEDPNSITILRQDQTNTDGSFDMANVIPGQYILVAIDHGWQINWGDRLTLRRYLSQGVPVDLKSSAIVKQNVDAQAP